MTAIQRRRNRRNDCIARYGCCRLSIIVICLCAVTIRGQQQEQQANGILDALWKFQQSLSKGGSASPSSSSNGNGDGDVTASDKQPTNKDTNQKQRRVTHRRGLFEHTLKTHYSKFLPEFQYAENHPNHASSALNNNKQQRSIKPIIDESRIDAKSGCVLFQEDGSDFWTYHWCPKSYVSQVHFSPSKITNGKVSEYKPGRINKLGTLDTNPFKTQPLWNLDGVANDAEVEYYTSGDYCYPSQDKRLRSKTKRHTLVVYETNNCDSNDAYAIKKVTEPAPCQYVIRVCKATEEFADVTADQPDAVDSSESLESEATIEEENVTDHLELMKDIQKVTAAYAKTTGVDQADMEEADRATSLHDAIPPFPPSRRKSNVDLIREMFMHSYDSYMYHAYPASEVKPLTCRPGTFDLVKLPALTLIDTLDTLAIMRNFTEFARGVERLRDLHKAMQQVDDGSGKKTHIIGGGLFSTNQNVSLFETNIRVLGGLLSAHQLALAYLENQVPMEQVRSNEGTVLIGPVIESSSPCETKPTGTSTTSSTVPGQDKEPCSQETKGEQEICSTFNTQTYTRGGSRVAQDCENKTTSGSKMAYWIYDDFLLELAHDLGKRMVPAFQTRTGIPYGTINLVDGIPNGESQVASLAGAGTLSLEFELLSRLTGDASFGNEAKLASRALWMRRSKKDLLGKHIDIERGGWTEHLSGIGSNSDSFYEYLVKHYILFPEDEDFWTMFMTSYYGVNKESRIGEWYTDVDMSAGSGGANRRVFESLMAFYPGMQVLLGELSPAARTLNGFFMVREAVGLLPERFNYGQWQVENRGAGIHPLRPELLESCYFLHKSTEGMSSARTNHSSTDGNSGWLWAADYALHTIHWHTWAECGYSTVSNVSPETTGGVPGSQAKNQGPKAMNEMPSFFLSETLKYLFLAFDEDNILHEDDDRHWVFTTEAHPIHHANLKDNDPKASETSKRRQLLYERLKNRSKGPRVQYPIESKSYVATTNEEKWAEKSLASDYVNQVFLTEKRIQESRLARPSSVQNAQELLALDLVRPSFLPIEAGNEDEIAASKQDVSNVAHLSLAPAGLTVHTMAMVKGCPNVYSPSLSWINAMNGGATDYSSVYVSSINDEIPVDRRYGVGLLSASHALALLGSGLFLGDNFDAAACPVSQKGEAKKNKATGTLQDTQRFDMGGTLGAFDVSVYAEGNGFWIKQVNTGESIIATVVHDDRLEAENDGKESGPYIMIYAATPPRSKKRTVTQTTAQPSSSWLPGMNWKSIFTREQPASADEKESLIDDDKVARSVVIGNGSGSAFSCELQIVRRRTVEVHPVAEDFDNGLYPIEIEEIIKIFPCAPALFGPTVVPRLIETNGVTMEGNLVAPDPEDEFGCTNIDEAANEISTEKQIRLVRRGGCTFQVKAKNQRQRGANAAVVINTDSHQLFLMARGAGDKITRADDSPVSTLISGNDGAELISLVSANSPEKIIAKVVVAPQRIDFDENGDVRSTEEIRFPVLRASFEAIQIFASGGWGVHAVERIVEEPTTSDAEIKKEWQLFLLQHSQAKDLNT